MLVVLDALAVMAGFWLGYRAARRRTAAADRALLALGATPAVVAIAVVLSSLTRLRVDGTFNQVSARFGTRPVSGGPLGYAILWMGAMIVAGHGHRRARARRSRSPSPPPGGSHTGGDERARPATGDARSKATVRAALSADPAPWQAAPMSGDGEDSRFMQEAIAEANAAALVGDVPVGAVVVDGAGAVVARGRNRREADQDPTAHAEIDALRRAAAALGHWRLEGATVFVTLEPCPMCAGALVNARVARVVYGCPDPKAGALDTLFAIGRDPRLNHRFAVTSGVLGEECAELLKGFFARLRARGPRGDPAPT